MWPETRGGPSGGDLLADVRPQPVGADQQRAGDAIAIGEPHRHGRAVLLVAHHFRTDAQLDQIAAFAGAQKHAMQVAAMHDRIGVAEAGAKGVAEIDMGDLFARSAHPSAGADRYRRPCRARPRRRRDSRRHETRSGRAGCRRRSRRVLRLSPAGWSGCPFAQGPSRSQARRCRRRRSTPASGRHRHQPDLPRCSSASSARSGTREELVVEIDELRQQRQQQPCGRRLSAAAASAPAPSRPTARCRAGSLRPLWSDRAA